MDSRISLDPHLIARLTQFSKQGIDPSIVIMGKTQYKKLTYTLKKKFKLKKGDRGFEIESINDQETKFAT